MTKNFCLFYSTRSQLFGTGGASAAEVAVRENCTAMWTMLNSEPELDAAFAVHASGIRLHAILPYEGQADRWPETLREKYFNLLPLCDKIEYIDTHFTPGCMAKAENAILSHCQLAIFLNTGKSDPLLQRAKTLGIAVKELNQ